MNMAGTGSVTSFSFTKQKTSTRVRLGMQAGFNNTTAVSQAKFGMLLNSVDYDVTQAVSGVTTNTIPVSGFIYVGSGVVAAGTYTVQARWKRSGGSGTLGRGVNEWLSIEAMEID